MTWSYSDLNVAETNVWDLELMQDCVSDLFDRPMSDWIPDVMWKNCWQMAE
jgi:hypothetical protein